MQKHAPHKVILRTCFNITPINTSSVLRSIDHTLWTLLRTMGCVPRCPRSSVRNIRPRSGGGQLYLSPLGGSKQTKRTRIIQLNLKIQSRRMLMDLDSDPTLINKCTRVTNIPVRMFCFAFPEESRSFVGRSISECIYRKRFRASCFCDWWGGGGSVSFVYITVSKLYDRYYGAIHVHVVSMMMNTMESWW